MIEIVKARLELLSVEMETVSLLGHTAASDSPHQIAAKERQIELQQEISRIYHILEQARSETRQAAEIDRT
jgi:hypothetical protein